MFDYSEYFHPQSSVGFAEKACKTEALGGESLESQNRDGHAQFIRYSRVRIRPSIYTCKSRNPASLWWYLWASIVL